MIEATQPHVERAISTVEAEIDVVTTERDAFRAFLARLHDIRPATSTTTTASPGPEPSVPSGTVIQAVQDDTATDGLAAVRSAYRETVMDTPHYEREYGDTLAESLETETSTALAEHVTRGGRLRPTVRDAFVEAAEQASDDRRRFLSTLRRERDSLEAIASELNEIEREVFSLQRDISGASSEQLAAIDQRLQALERRGAELARQRQELIHNRQGPVLSGIDGTSLVEYLYGEMETRCPALADAADCLDVIRNHRQRCLR
jgi:hypothetical protein